MTALAKAPILDYALARFNMVEGQLRPNKVTDPRLLAAFSEIPRELFVPSTLVGIAYLDENIPLIEGRFLIQPMVLARLIEALEVKSSDRVLDLAPATGYSTLVLSALTDYVTGVEPNSTLYKEAENNVANCTPGKVKMLAGAPVECCAVQEPFDVILVNGSVEFLPEIMFEQLAEGGRLAAVVRRFALAHAAHTGQARLYRKNKGSISWVSLFDANVPPAPGFTAPRGFAF